MYILKIYKGEKMNRLLLVSITLLIFIVGISCVSAAGIGSGSGFGYTDCSGTSIGAGGITFHGGSYGDSGFGPNYGKNYPSDFNIPPGASLFGPEPENHNKM